MKEALWVAAAVATLAIAAPVRGQAPPNATPPSAYSGPSPRGETQHERAAASHSAHQPHHAGTTMHRRTAQRPSTADQLNREEFSHLGAAGPNPTQRMPTGGRAISGGNSPR